MPKRPTVVPSILLSSSRCAQVRLVAPVFIHTPRRDMTRSIRLACMYAGFRRSVSVSGSPGLGHCVMVPCCHVFAHSQRQAKPPHTPKKRLAHIHSSFVCQPLRMTTLFPFGLPGPISPFRHALYSAKDMYITTTPTLIGSASTPTPHTQCIHTSPSVSIVGHGRVSGLLFSSPEGNRSAWGTQVFCRPLYPYMHSCLSRFIHSPLAPAVCSSGLPLYDTARLYSLVI